MKICIINNLYAPFSRGGAETAARGYAAGLRSAGHEVMIISTLPWGRNADQDPDGVRYLRGFSSTFFYLDRIPFFLRPIWHLLNVFNICGYFSLKNILRNERPGIVMTHNLMGVGFLAPLAIRRLRLRHFHFIHDIQLLHPSGLMDFGQEAIIESVFAKTYQSITRKLFGSPEKIISPSAWLSKAHVEKGFFSDSEKIVLANPVSMNGADIAERLPRSNKFSFLYVGQIEAHKGALELAEAFTFLGAIPAELIFVGDGSQYEDLKKFCAGRDNIKVLGREERSEVVDRMKKADCLVVPSLCYENSPTVIFEAIACGLPVIASDIGGIGETIEDERFRFKPGDVGALAAKLAWAIANQEALADSNMQNKKKLVEASQIIEKLGI